MKESKSAFLHPSSFILHPLVYRRRGQLARGEFGGLAVGLGPERLLLVAGLGGGHGPVGGDGGVGLGFAVDAVGGPADGEADAPAPVAAPLEGEAVAGPRARLARPCR